MCFDWTKASEKHKQMYAHSFSTMNIHTHTHTHRTRDVIYNKNAFTHQANSFCLVVLNLYILLIRWSFRVQFAKKTTSLVFNKIDINQFSVGYGKGAMVMFFQLYFFFNSLGFGFFFVVVVVFSHSLARTMTLPSSQLHSVMIKLVFFGTFILME